MSEGAQGAIDLLRRCAGVLLMVAVGALGGPTAPESEPTGEAAPQWQPPALDAAVLREIVAHNIFTGKRARPEQDPEPPSQENQSQPSGSPERGTEPVPVNPDDRLVLVGVSIRGGHPVAFIEDRGRGEVQRVTEAEAFSRGRIISINLQGVVYQVGDQRLTVQPGESLAGDPVSHTSPAAPQPPADPAPGNPETEHDGDDGAGDDQGPARTDVLERMRQRRVNERGRSSNE